jgi:hypothetical protein
MLGGEVRAVRTLLSGLFGLIPADLDRVGFVVVLVKADNVLLVCCCCCCCCVLR